MSTLEKGHPGLNRWYRVKNLVDGQRLMGYRFCAPEDDNPLHRAYPWYRSGTHLIINSEPMAGPVYLRYSEDWGWHARCIGCTDSSKGYKIKHYGLVHWAQRHLCKTRVPLEVLAR